MQYFILMPGDTESELTDANNLGEESFGTFWAGAGFDVLMDMVNTKPYFLDFVIIKNDQGKKVAVTEFLDAIKGLKLKHSTYL